MSHNVHEEDVLGKAYDGRLMRRLLAYMRPYKFYVSLAILVLLLSSFAQLAGPYLTKLGIDNFIAQGNAGGLRTICVLYLLILMVDAIFQFCETYLVNWIGQKAMFDMRSQIFAHIQSLPIPYFDRNPVGRLVTRVTTDVSSLHQMLSSGAVAIFGDIFKLVGIVGVLLFLNWKLALVTFSVLPLLFYATFLFKRLVREIYRVIRLRIARINTFLQENVSGMSVVQLFRREATNFNKFDRLNAEHRDSYLQTILYYAMFFPVVRLISSLAVALIVWYGGGRVIQGALTFGGLVAFIQYADMFFRPIMDLSEKYNLMQSAMASSERIFKIMDEKSEPWAVNRLHPRPNCRGEIEFRNVWFAYKNDDFVLEDISFHVRPGEKVAFVGATGAGKTSLLSLLLRYYDTSRGEIFLDGVNIQEINPRDLRRYFGMVMQDIFIFDGSVARNIRLEDSEITDEQVRNAARDVHAEHFIEKLPQQYEHAVLERGKGLSVGQRQLLSFARALAHDPPILILDEATSSVDTETELLIQDALQRLMQNRTSLVVAHRLSTVQNSDRIIVLHKGRIREIGSHHELLARRGLYHQLYQLQYAQQERQQAMV